MILVGPPAIEPPGVPVDAGDLAHQGFPLELRGHVVVELVPQLLHGPVEVVQVVLLVGFAPGPLVV